jgi:tetratricopeptide (TPR) repeat protein
MIRKSLIPVIFLLLLRSAPACVVPSDQKEWTSHIVTLILEGNYDLAIIDADSAAKGNNTDPLPSVLKLAVIGMRDVDFELTVDSAGFITTYGESIRKIRDLEKNKGTSSYTKMLTGFSKAIHSTFFLRRKLYFSAMQNGLDAISSLKDAKQLDSSNTDVDFFLGLYDYSKAELRKQLWWVLFWYPGSKTDGIRKLTECSESACITNSAALLSLSDIYLREKKPGNSLKILEQLIGRYPKSRFVLWAKAKYFEYDSLYADAAKIYGLLSDSYEKCQYGKYNSMVTRNKQAHMFDMAGMRKEAVVLCRDLLQKQDVNNNKEIIKDTRKLLERLDGKHSPKQL